MLRDKLPALSEPSNDFISFGQINDRISAFRVRLDRKDLAVDTKAADVVGRTKTEARPAVRQHSPCTDD